MSEAGVQSAHDIAAHLDALRRMRLLEPYYRWVLSLIEPWVGRRVLDAGCGIGNFTSLLLERCDVVVAADDNADHLRDLRERFTSHPRLEILHADVRCLPIDDLRSRKLDTVVCLDVLEHVDDDVSVLRAFRQATAPQGRLLLKVPAHPRLFSAIDAASGHVRRYSRRRLAEVMCAAGWDVVALKAMNLFGVPAYWLKSRVFRARTNFSRSFSNRSLRWIAKAIPVLRSVDRLVGPPAGLSLVACGVKKPTPTDHAVS